MIHLEIVSRSNLFNNKITRTNQIYIAEDGQILRRGDIHEYCWMNQIVSMNIVILRFFMVAIAWNAFK